MATKASNQFACTQCDHRTNKQLGRCPNCQQFGTIEPMAVSTVDSKSIVGVKSSGRTSISSPALLMKDINTESHQHKSTGIGELDRVLGGGLVAGGVILLAGSPGVGKALSLDTPIATPQGWSTIGQLEVGDEIFGEEGKPTKVVALSEIWKDRPVYEVVFSDGARILADENHEWLTITHNGEANIHTTLDIKNTLFDDTDSFHKINHSVDGIFNIESSDGFVLTKKTGKRYVIAVNPVESVPVRCIEVDNESHLFLAGKEMIPTHNSSILAMVSHHLSMHENVLYVSGEESIQQIKLRHRRMNAEGKNLYLASENDLSKVLWQIDEVQPRLIIVDSLQTIATPDIDGRAGSPSQVTEVATIMTRIAKERGIPVIFVGHYTKAGDVAGPRVVEHLVDVVLSFEGEEDSTLRLLRGIKNRFGPADEIGCFEHTETGLEEVSDPSGLLLGAHTEPVSGVATSIFLEGKRALPIEIQALVTSTVLPNPRKVTSGLDSARTIMIQAVLQKHGGISLGDKDVYVSTIGGMKVREPAVDLATVIALISAQMGEVSRNDAVAIGEVTLSGEIRKTTGMHRRLTEAVRLGFNTALVPVGTKDSLPKSLLSANITLIELKDVRRAVAAVQGFAALNDIRSNNG